MKRILPFPSLILLTILVSTLAFCTVEHPSATPADTARPATTQADPLSAPETTVEQPSPLPAVETATQPQTDTPAEPDATITIQAGQNSTPVNACLFGTNVPAWLSYGRFDNTTFQARTIHAGLTMLRLPGGSWSNSYDWLGCENGDGNTCYWTWAGRPTDFIDFMQATGQPGMWTVNLNGTSKEAAALVAFFNGSPDDTRTIGTDIHGTDWGTVGQWAQLRAQHGNPDPVGLQYWEIGNEIYGGTSGSGTDCAPWGWEPTWTCDGTEYVNGLGSGSNRHEGFLEFVTAMKAVDSTIKIGAVGVSDPSGWANWGNEVIAGAGDVMDFYIVHEYAYDSATNDYAAILAKPQSEWGTIMADLTDAFDQYADGRDIPVATTEFNMFAYQAADGYDLMSKAVNALFMADSLGQMMTYGYDVANQWDLAHGDSSSPAPSYGLMQGDTFFRTPQYYIYPLWARFGLEIIPVTNPENPATTLSVYAGWVDDNTLSVLAINKTGNPLSENLAVSGISGISGGVVDVAVANSLTATSMTFNGVSNPSDDLSNAPSTPLSDTTLPVSYTFAPYSITLIRMEVSRSSAFNLHSKQAMGGLVPWVFLPYVKMNGTPAPTDFTCSALVP